MSYYLPEVHDVHPGAHAAVRALVALLSPAARRCAALLVVPRWPGDHSIDADTGMGCLRALQAAADQVVLHGLTHTAPPTWWSRLRQGSHNDSEFARVPPHAARAWINDGANVLEAASGHRPRWFCAPRWEQNEPTAAALRAAGFAGWMLRDRLVLAGGGTVRIPAVWFDDGERAWVRSVSCWRRTLALDRLFAARHPFRLALHPRDISTPDGERELRQVLSRLDAEGWHPVTLNDAATTRASAEDRSRRW